MAWFQFSPSSSSYYYYYFLLCLSGFKPQTVSDCGQEEGHAMILGGKLPNSAEPTTWHCHGFGSNTARMASLLENLLLTKL